MLYEAKRACDVDTDILFVDAQLLQVVHLTCYTLLVAFRHREAFVKEGISAQAYAHPRWPYLVVTVDLSAVIASEHHDDHVAYTAEKHLILVHDQDIIDEAVIMSEAFEYKALETTGEVL